MTLRTGKRGRMTTPNESGWKRSLYCGELRKTFVGRRVVLFGWVNKHRDIGHLIFFDLRDREGMVQIVCTSDNREVLTTAKKLRREDVVGIKGFVKERDEKDKNAQLPTGEVEITVEEIRLFNASAVPPFQIGDPSSASEELRLKYRYLDLRRPSMQNNLRLRHRASMCVRNFFDRHGFFEIETPFLTKSTPEGARDYLVPSRIYKGRFFALPQSPQLFKQLTMISGFDRYYQIVRCFRDEDQRADRQPEFTQIDVEMSFPDQEEFFDLNERLMEEMFALADIPVKRPFLRMTYEESMERYGTDRPDLRFGMELTDLTEQGRSVQSRIIEGALAEGSRLKGLVVPEAGGMSRGQLDRLNDEVKASGGKGIIWIKRTDGFKSSLKLEEEDFLKLWNKSAAQSNDLLLLVADEKNRASYILGDLRLRLRPEGPAKESAHIFVWITDFPMFEWSAEDNRLTAMHHPFTSPLEEDLPLLDGHPLQVRANAYDLVLNGTELGGGSVRIHGPGLQKRIFEALGLEPEEAEQKFGFFLEALRYGTPPHGGIAYGFDRIVMFLCGEESIREVIPFPKTTSSLCLLTDAPAAVDQKQLRELGLKLTEEKSS